MNIHQIIDAAKNNSNVKTDADLANLLGVSPGVPYTWKHGVTPKLPQAHKLAEIAGLDPAQVITDLLIEGEKVPEVKSTLERIKSALLAAAAVIPALVLSVHYCILC